MKALESETSKAIRGSAAAIRALAGRRPDAFHSTADRLSGRRLWLVGLGTSFHAALVGEHLFRSVDMEARAVRASDFALYPPQLGRRDALVALTESGGTGFTRDAVAHARKAGAFTLAITAAGAKDAGAEHRFETVPRESSRAHTASFIAALFELGRLALESSARSGPAPSWAADWERTPEWIELVLSRESELEAAARAAADAPAIYAIGAGPNAATASEAALKIREMSRLRAEPFELETALHGPLVAVNRGDFAALFLARGPAIERSSELATALERLGAAVWRVGARADGGFLLEGVDEAWSPAVYSVAAQLFALKLASLRGSNPDVMRRDDPVYEKAFDGFEP